MATANSSKRHPAFKDETGKRYGRLQVVEYLGRVGKMAAAYRCICDCGNETVANGGDMRAGKKASCGCKAKHHDPMFSSIDDCPPLPVVSGVEIRHCPGRLGYAIGSDGTPWGCRWPGGWRTIDGFTTNDGYHQILTCIEGKRKHVKAHVLVLEAFVGPRPSGMVGRHLDGNSSNNLLANLAWGTPSENQQDSVRHGTSYGATLKGNRNPQAKLTEDDARAILFMKGKVSQYQIAEQFGVTQGAVSLIHTGKLWSYLTVGSSDEHAPS